MPSKTAQKTTFVVDFKAVICAKCTKMAFKFVIFSDIVQIKFKNIKK